MTATGEIRILISTNFEDSAFLCPDSVCVADAILRTLHDPAFSLLEIRVVMPSQEAEELLLGMLAGHTELSIEQLTPLTGPEHVQAA
jgi:hypothetical protein